MSVRIPLTLSKAVQQNTNVARFMVDAAKVRGLVEYTNGLVQVSFETHTGEINVCIVEESFETIAQAIIDSDYDDIANKVF